MENRRIFSRFRPTPLPAGRDFSEVPADGLCLNAFLVVTERSHPTRVLLGQVDPTGAWDQLGGLGPARVARLGEGWMLPASHLLRYESPAEAARRVAVEQLELPELPLEPPVVANEAWGRADSPAGEKHWDLHFIFRSSWAEESLGSPKPWRQMRFVEPAELRTRIVRGHDDILGLVGLLPPP
jgi:hypothetical protein